MMNRELLTVTNCCLLLLLLSAPSTGTDDSLMITQVEFTSGGTVPHPVNGIATYEIGPQARHFDFHCVSLVNDGQELSWSRLTGGSLTRTQNILPKGISLDLSSPLQSDTGKYRCSDSTYQKDIMITTDNPAVLATAPSQQADQGDNVTLMFYVSGLPAVTESEITWLHNGVALSSGDFQDSKRQLRIQDVRPADAGNYTILVATQQGTASATTILTIIADEVSEQTMIATTTTPLPTPLGNFPSVTPSLSSASQQPSTITTITITQCTISNTYNCPTTLCPTLTQSPSQTTPPQVNTLPLNLSATDFGLIGALGILTFITIILLVIIMLLCVSLRRAKQSEPQPEKDQYSSKHPLSASAGFSMQSRSKQELLS